MPDGNVIQYIRANPDANRLVLVRTHQVDVDYSLLTPLTIDYTSLPRPHVSSRVRYFTRLDHPGRDNEEISDPAD